jgi:hypothetical protein
MHSDVRQKKITHTMPPSKEEIKKKYGITEDDFAVLEQSSLPTSQELMRDAAALKKKGFWGKFEVWLKTTICGGVLLAVIFIGEVKEGIDAIRDFGTLVYSNRETIELYIDHFSDYATEQAKGLLVHTENQPTEEDKLHQEWAIFPTGSYVAPLSSGWNPS